MRWNWQRAEWPTFIYDSRALEPLERLFLHRSGEFIGVFRHVDGGDRDLLRIELTSDEAVKTSEIEGEFLARASPARARKACYAALERNNNDIQINDRLVYFAQAVLEARRAPSSGWISTSPRRNSTDTSAAGSTSARRR